MDEKNTRIPEYLNIRSVNQVVVRFYIPEGATLTTLEEVVQS